MQNNIQIEILLVEDNSGDVFIVKEALKLCEVEVHLTVANDGVEALELLAAKIVKPDLMILDLHMPKIDGLVFLERLGPTSTPIVLFSSNCQSTDAQRARELGASECLEKPADLDAFIHAVCELVTRWSAPLV